MTGLALEKMEKMMLKPNIPDVVRRFADYYDQPQNGVWGSLHIVLDDGNVSNGDVEFCRDAAVERGDEEGRQLAELLLAMSRTQRLKLPKAVDAFLAARKAEHLLLPTRQFP